MVENSKVCDNIRQKIDYLIAVMFTFAGTTSNAGCDTASAERPYSVGDWSASYSVVDSAVYSASSQL